MAKTIVGLFDDAAEAQRVVQDLVDSGFRRENISIVANQRYVEGDRSREVGDESAAAEGAGAGALGGTVLGGALGLLVGAGLLAIPGIGPVLAAGPLAAAIGTTAATVGAGALGAGIGAAAGGLIGGLVGSGVPEDEANYYAEGVRRGGTLVTVGTSDDMANTAYNIMQRHGAVDIDDRRSQWREEGWTGFDPNRGPYDEERRASGMTGTTAGSMAGTTAGRTTTQNRLEGDETVLPVVEEDIDVSKRRVERGGVRVSTHVEERPVEEDVTLREEHVHVERRPVDRPVTDADRAAFQEGSFEVSETAEEAVVRKRARVVEEVIIDKDVSEHTETIRDTVRRTDVDVDQTRGEAGSGFGTLESDYRSHYQKHYGNSGYSYEEYTPLYRYGYSLANDSRYRGREWRDIESDARTRWEERNPGTWEQFKDSVRYAWDKARGRR